MPASTWGVIGKSVEVSSDVQLSLQLLNHIFALSLASENNVVEFKLPDF